MSASPSRLLLNSGNFLSAATLALIRKASMVTLMPLFSFSLLVETRKASRSVMSASSWLVTAGIMIALRSRLAPLIFLMRDISLRSTGPNLAKSTLGQGIRPSSEPPPPEPCAGALAAWALVWVAPLMTDWVNFWMSSAVMRPFWPEPLTSSSGTPSSRANLRTDGDACGRPTAGVAVGLWAGAVLAATGAAAAAAGAAAGAAADATVAAAATGAGAAEAVVPSKTANRSPMLTLSPTLTLSSLSTPACEDGISIEALSDSTVIRLCSTLMLSPGLTKTSMTDTSLKSPMSGTCTSTGPAATGSARTGLVEALGAGASTGSARTGAEAAAGAAAPAPSASISRTTEPSLTLSPSWTLSSLTRPACEDGISMEALSDSTVMSDCSALTVSPGLTSSSMTATSSKSPMSGTFTSTNAMFVSGFYAYRGLTLSTLMPYFLMASATLAAGSAPSSASDLSAAITL